MANEIVLYKPNEQFQLEVQVMDETVWLTQQQMAQLFGVAENNITYHIRGIYKTQELEPTATAQKIRVVRPEDEKRHWLCITTTKARSKRSTRISSSSVRNMVEIISWTSLNRTTTHVMTT